MVFCEVLVSREISYPVKLKFVVVLINCGAFELSIRGFFTLSELDELLSIMFTHDLEQDLSEPDISTSPSFKHFHLLVLFCFKRQNVSNLDFLFF